MNKLILIFLAFTINAHAIPITEKQATKLVPLDLKWECISNCSNDWESQVFRMPVHNGWLVKVDKLRSMSMVFVEDKNHLWK